MMSHSAKLWEDIEARLAQQHWPESALYVVATPIGNLLDLSWRAWHVLRLVDAIAAEDTRSSATLLKAWHIDTPLMAAHRHNERQAAVAVIERLNRGERVALISDAGSPAISDPGGQLVADVRAAGFEVVVVPGPSAAIAALMASGASTDRDPGFVFLGFLPNKSAARQRAIRQWQGASESLVMFEAPHRIVALLMDLETVLGGHRQVSLCRELTKRFEQTVTLALDQAVAWVTADGHRQRGEYVVVIHPSEQRTLSQDDQDQAWQTPQRRAWMGALLSALSTRDAAKVMSQALGLPKDACYARLLEYRHNGSGP
jgi:16S rRNA (cytidine1402-2'-O)-methyltransferase